MTPPLQTVTAKHGSKKKLVETLAATNLSRREGESKDAFKKRLSHVSNRKLLRLLDRK